MKIRTDFVTNSSSTCYVCEISGEKEATGNGDDTTRQDLGFMVCEKGHWFKSKYAIQDEDTIRKALENKIKEINSKNHSECEKASEIQEMIEELPGSIGYIVEEDPFGCGVPSEMCPICQMEYISEKHILKYLSKSIGFVPEDIVNSMKKRYSSYDEMIKELGE